MKRVQDSERKQKKLEKKKKKQQKKQQKQQKKRRKRINARIDRTVSLGAIMLCLTFSVLDVLERRGKLPWRKK